MGWVSSYLSLSHLHLGRTWHGTNSGKYLLNRALVPFRPASCLSYCPHLSAGKQRPRAGQRIPHTRERLSHDFNSRIFTPSLVLSVFFLILFFRRMAYHPLELMYTEASSIMHMLWKVMFETLGSLICQMFGRKIYCSNYSMQMAIWKLTNYVI